MQYSLGMDPLLLVARLLAFAVAIPFHEAAHAFVSDKLGDPTARNLGRLTLNPLKHLDPWGLLAMLTIGIGWAKPVPVDSRYYKNRRAGTAISAVAGPVSNLLLSFVSFTIAKVFYLTVYANITTKHLPGWADNVYWVLMYFAVINITLAIFNMLPIPPLDGSRLFGLLLPGKVYYKIAQYERYIMIGLLVVLFILPRVTPFNPIGWLLGSAGMGVINFFDWITRFIEILFAGVI